MDHLWQTLHTPSPFWTTGRVTAAVILAVVVTCVASAWARVVFVDDKTARREHALRAALAAWAKVAAVSSAVASFGFAVACLPPHLDKGWVAKPLVEYVQDEHDLTALSPVELTHESVSMFGESGDVTGAKFNAVRANGDVVGVEVRFTIPLDSTPYSQGSSLPRSLEWLTVDISERTFDDLA